MRDDPTFPLIFLIRKIRKFLIRKSRSQMFFKIGVLKLFANFTEKRLCWSLFLIKLQAFMCFPVKFSKFLRMSFSIEHLRWLIMILLN